MKQCNISEKQYLNRSKPKFPENSLIFFCFLKFPEELCKFPDFPWKGHFPEFSRVRGNPVLCGILYNCNIVETLYNTINFCWSTHKRHSIARPKGRGMECLLWVQRATYYKLIDIELYEIFAIINRAIKGLHCISEHEQPLQHGRFLAPERPEYWWHIKQSTRRSMAILHEMEQAGNNLRSRKPLRYTWIIVSQTKKNHNPQTIFTDMECLLWALGLWRVQIFVTG